ncbi:gem-associated protein 6 [Polymixia lowei]
MCEWILLKPLNWEKYVNKLVNVTAHGQQHRGWLFTVDPVTASVVLVSFRDAGGAEVRVVMGHAVQQVEILQDGDEEITSRLRAVFVRQAERPLSSEELRQRREDLRRWLEKNRIPVEEQGDALRVADVLTVNAPYRASDCCSSNEIILARVQSLVEGNPGMDRQPGSTD